MQNLALPNVAHCVSDVRLFYRSPTDAISRDIALDNSQSGLTIIAVESATNPLPPLNRAPPQGQPIQNP